MSMAVGRQRVAKVACTLYVCLRLLSLPCRLGALETTVRPFRSDHSHVTVISQGRAPFLSWQEGDDCV